MVKLSLVQLLRMSLFGHVPIGERIRSGWKGPIMFYAFRCQKHGIVNDYPHGHKRRLECPLCVQESLEAKWKYA